jgi:hypothetical protein
LTALFPAPWYVDAYMREGGEYIWGVRANDHAVILEACGEAVARRVVEARNASGDTQAIRSIQSRWQAALDAAHQETERVRQHFSRENAQQRDEIYRLQSRLQETILAGDTAQASLDLGA